MESYQRKLVGLIRETRMRVGILSDHRIVDLWREYSLKHYERTWQDPGPKEVGRFLTWALGQVRVVREIGDAERARTPPVISWKRPTGARRPGS